MLSYYYETKGQNKKIIQLWDEAIIMTSVMKLHDFFSYVAEMGFVTVLT